MSFLYLLSNTFLENLRREIKDASPEVTSVNNATNYLGEGMMTFGTISIYVFRKYEG